MVTEDFGVNKFRLYSAWQDSKVIAAVISADSAAEFIVDIGYVWAADQWGYWEPVIPLTQFTQYDVDRYLTKFIDEIGEEVKAENGENYEWLDHVTLLAPFNEMILHWVYGDWGLQDIMPTADDFIATMNNFTMMVHDFLRRYRDGRYLQQIEVTPILASIWVETFLRVSVPIIEYSINMNAAVGAPTGMYVNIYPCFPSPDPMSSYRNLEGYMGCVGVPGVVESSLEKQVTLWKTLPSRMNLTIPLDNVKLGITETGWLTKGWKYMASEYLSANFYSSLITSMANHSSSLYGVDVYFFELFDEDLKPDFGYFEDRWWGFFYGNGTVKELNHLTFKATRAMLNTVAPPTSTPIINPKKSKKGNKNKKSKKAKRD